jgi:hypothetical protein
MCGKYHICRSHVDIEGLHRYPREDFEPGREPAEIDGQDRMPRYILGNPNLAHERRHAARAMAHHGIYYAFERERGHRLEMHLTIIERDMCSYL